MKIRILTGTNTNGQIKIMTIGCPRCEDCDVWTWQATEPPPPALEALGVKNVSVIACTLCDTQMIIDMGKFTVESINERDGWFSRRHKNREA